MRGCYGKVGARAIWGGLTFVTCPANYWSTAALEWIKTYKVYKRGIMPFNGCYMEQPAKAIQIFETIESLEAEEANRIQKANNGK